MNSSDDPDTLHDPSGFNTESFLLHSTLENCPSARYPHNAELLTESFFLGHHVIYLDSGKADIWLMSADGQEMLLDFLRPGDFLGEAPPIAGQVSPNMQLISRYPCVVRHIPVNYFLTLLHHNGAFARAVMRQLARRQDQWLSRLAAVQFMQVPDRIFQVLRELCADEDSLSHPDGVVVRITRQDLGRMVGCTRESAGRAIQVLMERQLIHAYGKSMLVLGERKPMPRRIVPKLGEAQA